MELTRIDIHRLNLEYINHYPEGEVTEEDKKARKELADKMTQFDVEDLHGVDPEKIVLVEPDEAMRQLIIDQAQLLAEWKHYAGREALAEMRRLAAEAVRLLGDESLAMPDEGEE